MPTFSKGMPDSFGEHIYCLVLHVFMLELARKKLNIHRNGYLNFQTVLSVVIVVFSSFFYPSLLWQIEQTLSFWITHLLT